MIMLWEGGTSSGCNEPEMVTLTANSRGYPFLIICGIMTEPTAAVSATEEPEMQPNIVDATMLTSAIPPRMKPTKTLARLTSRSAIPPPP